MQTPPMQVAVGWSTMNYLLLSLSFIVFSWESYCDAMERQTDEMPYGSILG